ncbi:MAG: hypothetical protein AAF517_24850, partial [Planctomycetota bacterium]
MGAEQDNQATDESGEDDGDQRGAGRPEGEFFFTNSGKSRRLDIFVAAQFPDFSRSYIKDLIDKGYVKAVPETIKTLKASWTVRSGNQVRVVVPPP